MVSAGAGTLSVGVPRERAPGERRVALAPEGAEQLRAAGHDVVVEPGAGERAWWPDADYAAAGARVRPRAEVLRAGLVAVVQPPPDLDTLGPGQVLVGLLAALADPERVRRLAGLGVTALSFDTLPRTVSRAQAMDALTSQAGVAGYKAALVAADAYGGWFPRLTTAAGTTTPAQVLVLGAGIAGLQAIATARRLGAVVTAFDVRASAQTDIPSLGAALLDVGVAVESEGGYARPLTAPEQSALADAVGSAAAGFDVVITAASTPGQRPPRLLSAAAVAGMRPGSVVLDAAAGPLGGNVEGAVAGERQVTPGGVTVIGAGDLAARVPRAASAAYSRNVTALVAALAPAGRLALDLDDEVQAGLVVAHGGQVRHPAVRALLGP